MINIRKTNLNLLVALDALLREQSVSKAAQKLFLTQSALSIILKQLREIFNDELLVREAKTMTLTPLAIQLAPKVKQVLDQIQALTTDTASFNPLTSNREFKLYFTPYLENIVLPHLYEYLLKHAPNIKLKIKLVSQFYDTDIFIKETEELYLGSLEIKLPAGFQKQLLFYETMVLLGHKNHPLLKKKITLDEYKHAKFIISKKVAGGEVATDLKTRAKRLLLSEKNIIPVENLISAMHLVEKTDFVTVTPKKIALSNIPKTNLTYQDLPFLSLRVGIFQVWPRRLNNDVGLSWLRNVITQLMSTSED